MVIEVGGVGYRVQAPTTLLSRAEPGGEIFVHVHTHVRDDAIVLFGFADQASLAAFEALLGAHGVGPSVALAVLSSYSASALGEIVSRGDVAALRAVPGVGAKTAARMLVDLEHRLGAGLAGEGGGEGADALSEVRSALEALGYSAEEARRATARIGRAGSVEELLRAALRELSAVG